MTKSAVWPLAIDPESEAAQTFQTWFFVWSVAMEMGIERFRKMLSDLEDAMRRHIPGSFESHVEEAE